MNESSCNPNSPQVTEELIDYRDLVRMYSFAEHARRADEYFAGLTAESTIARKPFADTEESTAICAGISAMIAGLKLFPGARVLDFGAGSCWSSRILALLRCDVVAADVSGKALELGRCLNEQNSLASQLQIKYVCLESETLPFPDAHFDRVLCFDALHHVPNQQNAIAEFARVLKTPGIIGLHEPGPKHSRGAQSQYEMRRTGVIEADVRIEELIAHARENGITKAIMALYCARPVFTTLEQFQEFLSDSCDASGAARQVLSQMRDDFYNRRICFLQKGDPDTPVDSRRPDGLKMEFRGSAERHQDHVRITGQVCNTGACAWLPSTQPITDPATVGDVNIGVHMLDRGGSRNIVNYTRRELLPARVEPGQSVTVDFTIPYPAGLTRFTFEIDLVAEHVAWFELLGSAPFKIDINLEPVE